MNAKLIASPNYDDRPEGTVVDLLVIHNISLPPNEFGGPYIEHFFTNRLEQSLHPYFQEIATLKVSCHCLIRRDGEMIQYVPFHKRAWHAGSSQFQGRIACNDFSIGVELEGADHILYTDSQYLKLVQLARTLQKIYPGITPDRMVGHQHIAPDRKTDPGPSFHWDHFKDLLQKHPFTPDVTS